MKNIRSGAIRLAALAFLVGLILGILVPKILAADSSLQARQPQKHVISNGETLWSLASRYGSGDPREFIYDIRVLNGLEGATIFPGQELILPRS
ncbi:MAG TPA: LysM peptidoglycan-binding domain-containing protein [Actinomycetota bacterium]|nr:LysM peptidoglycan-binding domain-containing protein [Actinomycetota bacterium]